MATTYDAAAVIGRFQLLHNGQMPLIRRALELAPKCLVVIGSSHHARTSKNPFTWHERVEMIRLAVGPADRDRLTFLPVRDYFDRERWLTNVRGAVTQAAGGKSARVALIGHLKDPTSDYLNDFREWHLIDVGSQGELHAKALRAALFSGSSVEAALAVIGGQVPATTVDFLRSWTCLPYFQNLRDEWRVISDYQASWAGAPYAPTLVTVDSVIHIGDYVLLVRRGKHPGKGLLALPGGFLEPRDTVYQGAIRETKEETNFSLLPDETLAALKAVRVFDHPDRSTLGRVLTHAHYFHFPNRGKPELAAGDDAAEAFPFPISELRRVEDQFHDDHFHILDSFGLVPAN